MSVTAFPRISVVIAGLLSLMLACSSSESDDRGNGGAGNASGAGPGSGGSSTNAGSGNPSGGVGGSVGGASGSGTGGSTNAGSGGTAAGSGAGGTTPLAGAAGTGTAGGGTGGSAGGGTGGTDQPGEVYPKPDPIPPDETGADLWLRYPEVPIPGRLGEYRSALKRVVKAAVGDSASLDAAEEELVEGLSGLTGAEVGTSAEVDAGSVIVGPVAAEAIKALPLAARVPVLGAEGYLVETATIEDKRVIVVTGNTELGVLYGSFALLRHLASHRSLADLSLSGSPRIQQRLLNHWDNLDRTIERGYAGRSLWDWNALPGTLSARYKAYARANASIGINGAVLNNVNASAQMLSTANIAKVKALADVFRPYGIKVWLTARFSAPIEIGGQNTADPANSAVRAWWVTKANEIYAAIPDFGGFLVKANSEGQPGPQQYGRTHADGANALAAALEPHGGAVLWRAFVYSETEPTDRIKQAYDEFKPLDGQFDANVLVQAKNGPLDFQPREPFHPLFGAMPGTPLALELQITKEYLGEDTHLAYLGPLFEEVLKADTHASAGATVAKVIDGSLESHTISAISGVANVGDDADWTGSQMNQANWYVFGRMAWDPDLGAEAVAEEWVRQTFSNDPVVLTPVVQLMMSSREALVNYMTPLGLVHIMGTDHHYGPAPWVSNLDRPEWNPVYYHKANMQGLGFDRSAQGSNAVSQYFSPLRETFGSRSSVPEEYLLYFFHVGWGETLTSGKTLWQELVHRYSLGVDEVGTMRAQWASIDGYIDAARFGDVTDFLQIQHYEARWWRDACLAYFGTFSNQAIPDGYAPLSHPLSFFEDLTCPADATKPRCQPVYSGEPSPAITQ